MVMMDSCHMHKLRKQKGGKQKTLMQQTFRRKEGLASALGTYLINRSWVQANLAVS